MVSSTPKEDPQAKADRERDRRLAEIDRRDSAQQEADDMTTDLRSVYGLSALSMFGRSGSKRETRRGNFLAGKLRQSIFSREKPLKGGLTQQSSQQLSPKTGFTSGKGQ